MTITHRIGVPGIPKREVTPKMIKMMRTKLGYTQDSFALFLGLSIETVRSWEQGKKRPGGPSRTLLIVMQHLMHRPDFEEIFQLAPRK